MHRVFSVRNGRGADEEADRPTPPRRPHMEPTGAAGIPLLVLFVLDEAMSPTGLLLAAECRCVLADFIFSCQFAMSNFL